LDHSALIKNLLAMRRHLSLVHQVPGRLRLRLGPGLWAQASTINESDLRHGLASIQGIKNVRLNIAAASLVIEYDAGLIKSEAWQQLLEADEDRARDQLQRWLLSD
jgi:hypothetical protein